MRAACRRRDVDRSAPGWCSRVCSHCRRHNDAEGIDGQRTVLGRRVVDPAITQIRKNPLSAILDGERDRIGSGGRRARDVSHVTGVDIGLGKTGTGRQNQAIQGEIAQRRVGDAGERVGQRAWWRIGIGHPQHSVGDGQRRRAVGHRLLHISGEHRVVVVRIDAEVDRCIGRGRRTGAATRIADTDIETVRRAVAAIMAVCQFRPVTDDKRAADRGGRDFGTVIEQLAVRRQTGDRQGWNRLTLGVNNRDRPARPANRWQQTIIVEPDTGLALDNPDASPNDRCLIHRLQGDIHDLVGEQATGTIVDGDHKTVGPGRRDLTTVVLIAELGNIRHRQRRADRDRVAVETQGSLRRQAGNLDDCLHRTVVVLGQTQLRLGEATARNDRCRKCRRPTFIHDQRHAPGNERRVIHRVNHDVGHRKRGWTIVIREIAHGNVDTRYITRNRSVLLGSRRKGHAIHRSVYLSDRPGNCDCGRTVRPGRHAPAAPGQAERAPGDCKLGADQGRIVAIGHRDAGNRQRHIFLRCTRRRHRIGNRRRRQQAIVSRNQRARLDAAG